MTARLVAWLRARQLLRVICPDCRCRTHDLIVHRYIDHAGDEL